jgi:hypothetical protein
MTDTIFHKIREYLTSLVTKKGLFLVKESLAYDTICSTMIHSVHNYFSDIPSITPLLLLGIIWISSSFIFSVHKCVSVKFHILLVVPDKYSWQTYKQLENTLSHKNTKILTTFNKYLFTRWVNMHLLGWRCKQHWVVSHYNVRFGNSSVHVHLLVEDYPL